jgi:CelD/BcsL family acetyltransferase involved in cellulose biosynthesis
VTMSHAEAFDPQRTLRAELEALARPDLSVVSRIERPALRVETLDPLSDPRWQHFVEGSSNGGIFHHREWLALLHAQYRYPMLARCVTDADGQLLAGLPFAHVRSRLTGERLVAVPFSDVCAPALAGGERDTEALTVLLDAVRAEHRRGGVDVEVRTPLEGFGHGAGFYHHELALTPDPDQLRRGFSKGVKSGISRARREGVEVRRGSDRAALGQFYELHLRTRRRQGVPTQPKRFIERYATLFERDLGFVLLACVGEEPVAAAVFLAFNGVLTYKYGASNPAHLKLQPNNALLMEAIRWGCENGMHTFDLGRTDLENEGLRSFKRGWGTRERELAYSCLPAREPGAARGGVPGVIKTVITRTPPLTGRLIGTALYRHFG